MDIWRWVNEAEEELVRSGRSRLAELLDVIPGYVVNHKHAQLDAVVPEAIALAREAKNPWLEVFVRHWNLQSRILHRHEVKVFLPEAVRLLELASRPEARECPQSVCVSQDLAGCYAKIDGPGYVAERLLVARETLGRIDARWPCFTCIASEYALALIDRGDHEEALAFMDEKAAELAAAGRGRAVHHLASARIEALLRLGRDEEAFAAAHAAKDNAVDDNDRVSHALDCAVALARLGRREEALAELPAWSRVIGTHSLYERWSQAASALALTGGMGAEPGSPGVAPIVNGGMENTWKLDAQLYELEARLHDNGVLRMSAELAERRARLAIARGRLVTAEACVEEIRAIVPELRAPEEVVAAAFALERDIAAAKAEAKADAPRPFGATVEEALGRLTDDPELDLATIREARARLPGEERLLLLEASALRALGRSASADALLRAFLDEHPDAGACFLTLGKGLLDRKDHAAARELSRATLARTPGVDVEVSARWILALSHRVGGEPDEAIPHLERILEQKPDSADVELLLAALHRDAGRLEESLLRLDRMIEKSPAPGNHDWDRMVVATLLDRWDKVRESARRVGMQVVGEGPIDEAWSLCRIELVEADGEATVHHAVRTGPVTARIIEVTRPRAPQHYGDEVVFEASPKNPPPAPGEERGHTNLYPVIKVRKAGGYQAFILDGVHPGDEAFAALRDALKAQGALLSVRSDESYELKAPDGGPPLKGLFAYLAVPSHLPVPEVHALLRSLTAGYAHPLIWPGITQTLKLEDELHAQAEIIDRYGL